MPRHPDEPTPPDVRGAPGPSGTGAVRVLLIDDDDAVRMALRRFFVRRKWEVEEAASVAEGLRGVLQPEAERLYTAVVCDLRLPDDSGVVVFRRVRAERPELLGRLIFSTGDATSPEADEIRAAGCCPVLEKPFDLAELAALVEGMRSG